MSIVIEQQYNRLRTVLYLVYSISTISRSFILHAVFQVSKRITAHIFCGIPQRYTNTIIDRLQVLIFDIFSSNGFLPD